MRALAVVLLLSSFASAGATIGVALTETPLRATAKADGIETGKLPRGSTVVIHHEEGDWLAIQAPPGSVSWIGHLFLEFPDKNTPFPKNAVVRCDGEVKLAVGRAGHPQPLDARKATVPEGTIVLVIGTAVKSEGDGTKWYPIVPPADDFRYVAKSAVQLTATTPPSVIVKSPANSTAPVPVPAAIAGPAPVGKANWNNHPLWLQAEQAEAAGDLDKAERLYFQLAREMNAPGGDGELANLCYSRVHAIREKRRSGGTKASGWSSAAPKEIITAANDTRVPEDTTPRIVPERGMERSEKPPEPRGQWSGSGYLRIAGFKLGTRQVYALEDSRGRLLYYAVPAAGYDLEKHRNKTLDLFGIVTNPKDLRGVPLIEVSKADSAK